MFIKKISLSAVILVLTLVPFSLRAQETLPHNILDNGEYAWGYFFIPGNSEQFWPNFSIWDVPISVPIHGLSVRYYAFTDSLDKKLRFYFGSGSMKFFYGSGSKQINDLYGYDAFSKSTVIGGTAALVSVGTRFKLNETFVFDAAVEALRFGACYANLKINVQRGTEEVEIYSCERKFVHSFSLGNAFASIGWRITPWRTFTLKASYDVIAARGPDGHRNDPVNSASASFGGFGVGLEELFNQYCRPNPLYIGTAITVMMAGVVAFFIKY